MASGGSQGTGTPRGGNTGDPHQQRQHERPRLRETRIHGRNETLDYRMTADFRHERAKAVGDLTGRTATQVEQHDARYRASIRIVQEMWTAEYRSQRDARHYALASRYFHDDAQARTDAERREAFTRYRDAMYEDAVTKHERDLIAARVRNPITPERYQQLKNRNIADNRDNYKAGGTYAHALEYLELRESTADWDVGETP